MPSLGLVCEQQGCYLDGRQTDLEVDICNELAREAQEVPRVPLAKQRVLGRVLGLLARNQFLSERFHGVHGRCALLPGLVLVEGHY